jgi:SnoaL-like domain
MTNPNRATSATEPPDVIARYLAAHDRHDTEGALSAFTADALVVDEDKEHRGTDGIRNWLESAGGGFTYTRTFLSARPSGGDGWLVVNRLDGDFPGNTVELRYQFVLDGDQISELVIAP